LSGGKKLVKIWQRIKEETLIKDNFGKEVKKAVFKNLIDGKEEEFILFGQRDWSTIIPVTPDGMVVTILEFKQGANKIVHNLPGGTANFEKESAEEVAKRELLEETGYQAKQVIFLGPPLWIASRNSWTRFYPFLALNCQKTKEKENDLEIIETKLYPLRRWIEMAQTEIEEPSAVVATFRALPYLTNYLREH
jgi:ADP-ribose pyrophosphatase